MPWLSGRVKDYSQIFVLKVGLMAEKRGRGRPRAAEGHLKNRTVPFRCQEKLYEELVAAAKSNRRTISQEIEARLNQTQEMSDRIRDLELRASEDRKTIMQQTGLLAMSAGALKLVLAASGDPPPDLPPVTEGKAEAFKSIVEDLGRQLLGGPKP